MDYELRCLRTGEVIKKRSIKTTKNLDFLVAGDMLKHTGYPCSIIKSSVGQHKVTVTYGNVIVEEFAFNITY